MGKRKILRRLERAGQTNTETGIWLLDSSDKEEDTYEENRQGNHGF